MGDVELRVWLLDELIVLAGSHDVLIGSRR